MENTEEDEKNKLYEIVENIYEKYKNDTYMKPKILNYFNNQIETIFQDMNDLHNKRIARKIEMTSEQDTFIETFLNNNQYFYNSSTDNYFFYDGLNYYIYNEDDILHNVLSSISRERSCLMSWKFKTKINIMKRIKETSLFKSIPESDTIQLVIDTLCPSLFNTRAEVKYFLTILGDNILKKQQNLTYFINIEAKDFIKELNNVCQLLVGCNLFQTFKYKYHDHNYNECRLVRINKNIKNESLWLPIIQHRSLNIMCVACHYSLRYNNTDDFLNNYCNDDNMKNHALHIKNLNTDDLVNDFINSILDIDSNNLLVNTQQNITNIKPSQLRIPHVTWKNMQYLWKQFLDDKELPSIMFLNTFKNMLTNILKSNYNAELDTFMGVCSKHLPAIDTFLNFWNETITIEEDIDGTHFEIEEIISLFRVWCEQNQLFISNLNDKQILDLIIHYYPHIEVEKDKYIYNISCSLWDKQMDIGMALDIMKNTVKNDSNAKNNLNNRPNTPSIYPNISIYDAYIFYTKYKKKDKNKLIVSKVYFEKYILDNYEEYIIDSKYLSSDWYL
jgi:hypothetical protein